MVHSGGSQLPRREDPDAVEMPCGGEPTEPPRKCLKPQWLKPQPDTWEQAPERPHSGKAPLATLTFMALCFDLTTRETSRLLLRWRRCCHPGACSWNRRVGCHLLLKHSSTTPTILASGASPLSPRHPSLQSWSVLSTLPGLPQQASGWNSVLPIPGAWVQSLVGKLRSHMPCGQKKKKRWGKRAWKLVGFIRPISSFWVSVLRPTGCVASHSPIFN